MDRHASAALAPPAWKAGVLLLYEQRIGACAHKFKGVMSCQETGLGSWTRTSGLMIPNHPRYQTALYPDIQDTFFFYSRSTRLSYLPMLGRAGFEPMTTDSQNQRNTFAVRILMAVPQRIELWSSDRQSDIIHHYTMRPRVAFDNPAANWAPTLCDECQCLLSYSSFRLATPTGEDFNYFPPISFFSIFALYFAFLYSVFRFCHISLLTHPSVISDVFVACAVGFAPVVV